MSASYLTSRLSATLALLLSSSLTHFYTTTSLASLRNSLSTFQTCHTDLIRLTSLLTPCPLHALPMTITADLYRAIILTSHLIHTATTQLVALDPTLSHLSQHQPILLNTLNKALAILATLPQPLPLTQSHLLDSTFTNTPPPKWTSTCFTLNPISLYISTKATYSAFFTCRKTPSTGFTFELPSGEEAERAARELEGMAGTRVPGEGEGGDEGEGYEGVYDWGGGEVFGSTLKLLEELPSTYLTTHATLTPTSLNAPPHCIPITPRTVCAVVPNSAAFSFTVETEAGRKHVFGVDEEAGHGFMNGAMWVKMINGVVDGARERGCKVEKLGGAFTEEERAFAEGVRAGLSDGDLALDEMDLFC